MNVFGRQSQSALLNVHVLSNCKCDSCDSLDSSLHEWNRQQSTVGNIPGIPVSFWKQSSGILRNSVAQTYTELLLVFDNTTTDKCSFQKVKIYPKIIESSFVLDHIRHDLWRVPANVGRLIQSFRRELLCGDQPIPPACINKWSFDTRHLIGWNQEHLSIQPIKSSVTWESFMLCSASFDVRALQSKILSHLGRICTVFTDTNVC